MSRLWEFLLQKRNREILAWLGGGAVVVAPGIWAVMLYILPPSKPQGTRPAEVEARCGAIAVGGNVTGSIVAAGATTGADCSNKPK
jgi:hypothetical protein